MSRNSKKPLAVSLATATCALLGTTTASPVIAQEEPVWEFNTALLYYGESDNRVEDISLNVLAQRNFVDDRILTLGLTVDSLTGATPYGAIPLMGRRHLQLRQDYRCARHRRTRFRWMIPFSTPATPSEAAGNNRSAG